ncbi:MAG: RNA pseudouridine synthase, partial [Clostridiales bacterium]|nr:RNA pseudouridine synthase [Clostridiales bacterium]
MNNALYIVDSDCVNLRIDKFVVNKEHDLTRSLVQKLIEKSQILVNDKPVSKNYKLKINDTVTIIFPEPITLEVTAQNIPIDIIYEDKDLLVVNKPKGMVVHPAPGNPNSTLVNALMYHYKGDLSSLNGITRPG